MLYFDNERKRQSKPSKKPCTFQGRAEMGSSRDFLVPLRSSIRIDEPRKQLPRRSTGAHACTGAKKVDTAIRFPAALKCTGFFRGIGLVFAPITEIQHPHK